MTPKPFVKFIPKRLPERKAVTIAAGFSSYEGVVLCADTQESDGYVKEDVAKISVYPFNEFSLTFTGAGDGELIDMLTQRMAVEAASIDPPPANMKGIVRVLETTLNDFFKQHLLPYSVHERPCVRILIAIHFKNAVQLYSTSANFLKRVDGAICIGLGRGVANSIKSRFYRDSARLKDLVPIAAYILKHAKSYADGCGGDSHVLAISRNGTIYRINQVELRDMDGVFERFDAATNKMFAAFSDHSVTGEKFSEIMATVERELKEVRKDIFRGDDNSD